MVNSDKRKLWSNTTSMEDTTVDVQPGIARFVNAFMPIIVRIAKIEMLIMTIEKISNRLAITSIKTEIAPRPCMNKEVKSIFDLPENRLPRCVTTEVKGNPDFNIPPGR